MVPGLHVTEKSSMMGMCVKLVEQSQEARTCSVTRTLAIVTLENGPQLGPKGLRSPSTHLPAAWARPPAAAPSHLWAQGGKHKVVGAETPPNSGRRWSTPSRPQKRLKAGCRASLAQWPLGPSFG